MLNLTKAMKKELAKKLNENRTIRMFWDTFKNDMDSKELSRPYTSNGNLKLADTDKVSFIIWNLPAVLTCPYRTKMCEDSCYAIKAEKQYGYDCLRRRFANYVLSTKDNFVEMMIKHLESKIKHHSRKGKTIVVRIHESGDFYNKVYAMKWLAIAEYFENRYSDRRVVFMAYTKSIPYFEGEHVPTNFCIRASIWADTDEKLIEMYSKYPIYTAMDADEMKACKALHCRCADCGTCGMCWDKMAKLIACAIH